jgi:hypothetical protein
MCSAKSTKDVYKVWEKKTENLKENIKAVKKEVIMNIHTVKDHQKKAAVLIVQTVVVTVAVAAAAAAKGSDNGRGRGRGSGCCG